MLFQRVMSLYNTWWMLRSHAEQKLAWEDARQARIARVRAEAQAAAQLQAMLDANPSGSLGSAKLNDEDAIKRSGLL